MQEIAQRELRSGLRREEGAPEALADLGIWRVANLLTRQPGGNSELLRRPVAMLLLTQ
jgi:hypothetical protein